MSASEKTLFSHVHACERTILDRCEILSFFLLSSSSNKYLACDHWRLIFLNLIFWSIHHARAVKRKGAACCLVKFYVRVLSCVLPDIFAWPTNLWWSDAHDHVPSWKTEILEKLRHKDINLLMAIVFKNLSCCRENVVTVFQTPFIQVLWHQVLQDH